MDTFITGYIFGIISIITIGIFIWAVRRGNKLSTGTLKERTNTNNSDTGSGLEKLKDINRETAKLNKEAGDTAREGLEAIDNTNRSISEIITAAKRKRRSVD